MIGMVMVRKVAGRTCGCLEAWREVVVEAPKRRVPRAALIASTKTKKFPFIQHERRTMTNPKGHILRLKSDFRKTRNDQGYEINGYTERKRRTR